MPSSLSATHEALIQYGLSFPSTHEDRPWGERVVKVRKKIFAFFGRFREEDDRLSLSVKLPDSAAQALDTGFAEPSGYGMGKHGWVTATFGPGDLPPMEVLKAWIAESYRAVAPKKLAAKHERAELARGEAPERVEEHGPAVGSSPKRKPAAKPASKPAKRAPKTTVKSSSKSGKPTAGATAKPAKKAAKKAAGKSAKKPAKAQPTQPKSRARKKPARASK